MPRTAAKPNPPHSAGPFTVERQSAKGGWTGISIRDGAGGYIANMVMQLAENEMANARLLAASAEMKEALQTLVAAADVDGWPPGWGLVSQKTRGALAKAEGR